MEVPFLARLKEFESPTFRLGGGRSILLSYKRICVMYYSEEKCFCQCLPPQGKAGTTPMPTKSTQAVKKRVAMRR